MRIAVSEEQVGHRLVGMGKRYGGALTVVVDVFYSRNEDVRACVSLKYVYFTWHLGQK